MQVDDSDSAVNAGVWRNQVTRLTFVLCKNSKY